MSKGKIIKRSKILLPVTKVPEVKYYKKSVKQSRINHDLIVEDYKPKVRKDVTRKGKYDLIDEK